MYLWVLTMWVCLDVSMSINYVCLDVSMSISCGTGKRDRSSSPPESGLKRWTDAEYKFKHKRLKCFVM